MIEELRQAFNARWTPEAYARVLALCEERTRGPVHFRIAETPVFLPPALMDRIVQAGIELTTQLLTNREYRARARAAVPEAWRVAGESPHPHFMTVDFGLVSDGRGGFDPRLVELQAFPSVFGFQTILAEAYREAFQLDALAPLSPFMGGLDEAGFWSKLGEVIVGRHAPENVILLEVTPLEQKTAPDFHVTEDRLGIHTVDITTVVQQGRRLFRRDGTKLIPIERIYNRAIVDEMVRRNIQPGFDPRAELDVEWAGHPNWYFEISKLSLPFLDHPTVPAAVFLDDLLEGDGRSRLPQDRERWVLKPLYSFAGKGITFAPTEAELHAIPAAERANFLVQERVTFAPTISTPEGPTQAEIRILYVWPDGGAMTPMVSLVRMGRGLMMGIDHNRNATWVGGSTAMMPILPRA